MNGWRGFAAEPGVRRARRRPSPARSATARCGRSSEGGLVRYHCRVGHAYSEDSMIIEQGSTVEAALWSALEALEERAEFLSADLLRHGERRAAAARPLRRARRTTRAIAPGSSGGRSAIAATRRRPSTCRARRRLNDGAERDPAFEALLEFLKRSRGFDFTGYKRASLERRFRRADG